MRSSGVEWKRRRASTRALWALMAVIVARWPGGRPSSGDLRRTFQEGAVVKYSASVMIAPQGRQFGSPALGLHHYASIAATAVLCSTLGNTEPSVTTGLTPFWHVLLTIAISQNAWIRRLLVNRRSRGPTTPPPHSFQFLWVTVTHCPSPPMAS